MHLGAENSLLSDTKYVNHEYRKTLKDYYLVYLLPNDRPVTAPPQNVDQL